MQTIGTLDEIADKIERRIRLSREEGRFLLADAPLAELGQLASRERSRRHPADEVSFVVDSNPNYTNVCVTDCAFCAFYRRPGDAEAWTLSVEEVMQRVGRAAELGCTTVLLQGGHNPALPFEYYLSLVRETRKRFPTVTPHFFTASEVHQMAGVAGLSVREVLSQLRDAGQSSIPGGGAEVLSDRVRLKVAGKKGGSATWLDVHRTAHQLGFRSTATMMYGHIETDEDLLEHFDVIRALQDETNGFTAFIPWSYKSGNTPMQRHIEALGRRPAGAARYLRILAASRLYLDNFDHIQASWFSEGKKTGTAALHFGADDFGGTIFEENVHLATGHEVKATIEEVKTLIREAGFVPVQRSTHYERLQRFDS